MDHLPLPRNPLIADFDVPFLAEKAYDCDDFYTFPQRMGWELTIGRPKHDSFFVHNELREDNEVVVGAFVQTWLYFGLLSSTLRAEVAFEEFRKQKLNTQVFDSTVLSSLIGKWSCGFTNLADESFLAELTIIEDRVRYASDVVTNHLGRGTIQTGGPLSRIYLSIAVLGEYIMQALGDMAWHRGLRFAEQVTWAPFTTGAELLTLLKRNGWCPSRVKYFDLGELNSVGMFWFYANLQPPPAHDKHQNCDEQQCFSLQVDLGEYQTLHMQAGCNCPFIGIDTNKLADIVAEGKVPLVRMTDDCEIPGVVLEVCCMEEGKRFMAISHVWADGRGNKSANALPECIIWDIQITVNSAAEGDTTENIPFWMDTLCLPLQPRSIRNKAIADIPRPFRNAEAVLVVDSYLQEQEANALSSLEILARMQASNWTTRLWTLCEGRLAKRVLFSFTDFALNMEWLVRLYKHTPYVPCAPEHEIWLTMLNASTFTSMEQDDFDAHKILSMKTALSTRMTSYRSDEALCLGIVLKLDLKAIVSAEDSQKMKVFWQSMECVPTGFLFLDTDLKLPDSGCRWAPQTLLSDLTMGSCTPGICEDSYPDAYPSAQGLNVALPTILLGDRSQNRSSFRFRIKYPVELTESESPTRIMSFWIRDDQGLWYHCAVGNQWHKDISGLDPAIDNLAILLSKPPAKGEDPRNDLKLHGSRAIHGIVIAYDRDTFLPDDTRQSVPAKALAHVIVKLHNSVYQNYWTEIEKCKNIFHTEHEAEIDSLLLAGDHKGLRAALDEWLLEYKGWPGLRKAIRLWDEATGKEMFDEEHLLMWSTDRLEELCFRGDLYKADIRSEPMKWCVD